MAKKRIKRICPLLGAGGAAKGNKVDKASSEYLCRGEDCMWFTLNTCAVTDLAEQVRDIAISLRHV